jgi:hypothetical protein
VAKNGAARFRGDFPADTTIPAFFIVSLTKYFQKKTRASRIAGFFVILEKTGHSQRELSAPLDLTGDVASGAIPHLTKFFQDATLGKPVFGGGPWLSKTKNHFRT